jgi:hypothetical protein
VIRSRVSHGIFFFLLALPLVQANDVWAQTIKPASPGHTILYRRAVSLLDQAEQKLAKGDITGAKAQAKEANSLFTILKKEYGAAMAGHALSPEEEQQLAISQKLAADAQTEADLLMETAAAHEKQAQKLEAQGQEEAAKAFYRQSKDAYNRAQSLYVKSSISSLRIQQRLFRFLAL